MNGSEEWVYDYDTANRLVRATRRDGSGTPLAQVDYSYDVWGNRLSARQQVFASGLDRTTQFGNDGGNVWVDLNVGNADRPFIHYVHGELADQQFARVDKFSGAGGTP